MSSCFMSLCHHICQALIYANVCLPHKHIGLVTVKRISHLEFEKDSFQSESSFKHFSKLRMLLNIKFLLKSFVLHEKKLKVSTEKRKSKIMLNRLVQLIVNRF